MKIRKGTMELIYLAMVLAPLSTMMSSMTHSRGFGLKMATNFPINTLEHNQTYQV